jgi:hypothetical protein
MIRKWKNFCCLLVIVLTVPVVSGCVAFAVGAAAGAGGYAYVKGSLEKNYDHTVTEVHKAASKALRALDIQKTDSELNKHSSYIIGLLEEGKKVKVSVTALTERSSKLEIRVGLIGDKTVSRMILNSIEKHL